MRTPDLHPKSGGAGYSSPKVPTAHIAQAAIQGEEEGGK